MKKTKLLMPLAGVAALGATIAPVAVLTSCSKGEAVYTIKFDANGGSAVADQKAIKDQLIHEPTSTKDGYVLAGWMKDDKIWDFETDKATGDMTLKASWVEIPSRKDYTDLMSYDIINVEQHAEAEITQTGEQGRIAAGKMYFAEDGVTPAKIIEHVKNDIVIELATRAKTLAASELIDPGCIEGFEWVGNIYSADAKVNLTAVEYQTGTNVALITGTIDMTLTARMIDSTTKQQIGEYILTTSHTITKVPYMINDYDEADHYWSVTTNSTILDTKSQYYGWSIDRTYYGIAIYNTGDVEDGGQTDKWYNKDGTDKKLPTKDNLNPITWDSTWMDTVSHGK